MRCHRATRTGFIRRSRISLRVYMTCLPYFHGELSPPAGGHALGSSPSALGPGFGNQSPCAVAASQRDYGCFHRLLLSAQVAKKLGGGLAEPLSSCAILRKPPRQKR